MFWCLYCWLWTYVFLLLLWKDKIFAGEAVIESCKCTWVKLLKTFVKEFVRNLVKNRLSKKVFHWEAVNDFVYRFFAVTIAILITALSFSRKILNSNFPFRLLPNKISHFPGTVVWPYDVFTFFFLLTFTKKFSFSCEKYFISTLKWGH